MMIDEVSMIDLSMLSTINNQCKIARSLDRSSPDLFGEVEGKVVAVVYCLRVCIDFHGLY
jgi:hypothetical protein